MKKTPKKQTHPVMMLVFFLFAVGCIAALFLFLAGQGLEKRRWN